jgi:hypothetical protein
MSFFCTEWQWNEACSYEQLMNAASLVGNALIKESIVFNDISK